MIGNETLPDFFLPRLQAQYSAEDVRRILEGCAVGRKTSLRANALKTTAEEVEAALRDASLAFRRMPWYRDAFQLAEAQEDEVRALPQYGQGAVYLQSLSSMIPPLALGDASGLDVCDMCAAPGGKTTQIMALSDGKALVTACEMHHPRAERLRHNLQLQGAANVTVMECDSRRLDDFFSFDRVLLDAPCSGSGTLSVRDPKLHRRFTPQLVEKSVKAQRSLVCKGLELLRPGGVLVYATCSVLEEENEDIVRFGLQRAKRQGAFELQPVDLPEAQGWLPLLPTSLEGALALCPTEDCEGFFIAKIRRTA